MLINPYTIGNAFSVQGKKAKKAYPVFDPEGDGYDAKTADMLIKKYPLTEPKPDVFIGDEIGNEDAFERWVWHPELGEYKKHGASFNPETGMLLKGLKYSTFYLTKAEEDRRNNEIYLGKDNRYYSRPRGKK